MNDARERLMEAMLEVVTERGYAAASVEEVVARAGVDQADFDRLFSSKEDCALVVMDAIAADFVRTGREAFEKEEKWPDSLRAAAYAQARWIKQKPREARFGAVEMLWAGELAQARREAGFQSLADLVDAGREQAEDPDAIPALTAEGVIGSIGELITKSLQSGNFDPLGLVRELMYVAVRPYLGEEAAARELELPPPRSTEQG